MVCLFAYSGDRISKASNLCISGGCGMQSLLFLGCWSRGQLSLTQQIHSCVSLHKPQIFKLDLSSLLCEEAHFPIIVWSIKSDGAGQPGKPEPHLIFRLISGRMLTGSKKVIQLWICQPERLNMATLEFATCSLEKSYWTSSYYS